MNTKTRLDELAHEINDIVDRIEATETSDSLTDEQKAAEIGYLEEKQRDAEAERARILDL